MANVRSYIIRFSLICSIFIFLFFFQNCIGVGVNFSTVENEFLQASSQESTEGQESSHSETLISETRRTHSETFISEARGKAVDMVWVVDNSPSMGEEAAHVRRNLRSFINTLESNIDIKITLLSKLTPDSYRTHVHLPVSALINGHLHINQYINSHNSLIQLNSYLPQLVNTMFREGSQKVFVFVTDDNSTLSSSDFVSAYTEILPNESPVIYGFIGLETRALSPCIESPVTSKRDGSHGSIYKQLSNMTGGEIYNICDSDWSENFSTLASSVIEKAMTSFTLEKRGIQKILDLKINDQSIDSSFYQLAGDTLKIAPSLVNQVGQYNIAVKYMYID